jgi:hypothetical protein
MPPKPLVRPPKAKRMTICIGLLASDGIVIAADSQESDQYYKRSQRKILPFLGGVQLGSDPKPPSMACAYTGAGEAGYIDAFFDDVVRNSSLNPTQQEFESSLGEKLRIFHEQHLFPLAVAKNPPEIQILVGAYVQWQTFILVSHGSTLRKAFPYAAVGAGAHFALGVLNDLADTRRDLRQTELLAAYIIAITKESIEGCGKYTQIVSLHNAQIVTDIPGQPSRLVAPWPILTHVPGKKIHKWEESFGMRWAPRQAETISNLMEEELEDDLRLEKSSDSTPLLEDQTQS